MSPKREPAGDVSEQASRTIQDQFERNRKVPLQMTPEERKRALNLCLRIHDQAMALFDTLEKDEVSLADIELLPQIDQHANSVGRLIQAALHRIVTPT